MADLMAGIDSSMLGSFSPSPSKSRPNSQTIKQELKMPLSPSVRWDKNGLSTSLGTSVKSEWHERYSRESRRTPERKPLIDISDDTASTTTYDDVKPFIGDQEDLSAFDEDLLLQPLASAVRSPLAVYLRITGKTKFS